MKKTLSLAAILALTLTSPLVAKPAAGPTTTYAGFIFNDDNLDNPLKTPNGIYDSANEVLIDSIKVELLNDVGEVISTRYTTSGPDIKFKFTDISDAENPAKLRFYVGSNAPYWQIETSPKDAGNDDLVDSDADFIETVIVPDRNRMTSIYEIDLNTAGDLMHLGLGVTWNRTEYAGTVWYDENKDGRRQYTENGRISNVKVDLLTKNGTLLGTKTTGKNGFFSFTSLDGDILIADHPDTKMRFTIPHQPKLVTIYPQAELGQIDQKVEVDGSDILIIPNLGENSCENGNVDLALYRDNMYEVSALVFDDKDGNGLRGKAEAPLADYNITITDPKDSEFLQQSAMSSENGSVTFSNLTKAFDKALYAITVRDANGSIVSSVDDVYSTVINSHAVREIPIQNVPHTATSQIKVSLWEDLNADGVRDTNEPALADVKVFLFDKDGLKQTLVTDKDGVAVFTGLDENEDYEVKISITKDGKEEVVSLGDMNPTPSGSATTNSAPVITDRCKCAEEVTDTKVPIGSWTFWLSIGLFFSALFAARKMNEDYTSKP